MKIKDLAREQSRAFSFLKEKETMKKYLIPLLLIWTLFLFPSQVLAREREMTIESEVATGLVHAGEVALYGYEFIATEAAGSIGIYDTNSATSTVGAPIKAEHQEATQYNSPPLIWFDEPILFNDGLYVHIVNANVILHYKK